MAPSEHEAFRAGLDHHRRIDEAVGMPTDEHRPHICPHPLKPCDLITAELLSLINNESKDA